MAKFVAFVVVVFNGISLENFWRGWVIGVIFVGGDSPEIISCFCPKFCSVIYMRSPFHNDVPSYLNIFILSVTLYVI